MLLQPAVVELVRAALGGATVAEVGATTGGRSHLTALLSAGGRRYAVKAAQLPARRTDLRREAQVLGLLAGSGLPVPAVAGYTEDDEWTVLVMVALGGRNGLAVYAEAPDELPRLYAGLGRVLAVVHRLCPPLDADLALAARARQLRGALEIMELADDLRAALAAGLAHPAWHGSALTLVHGDPGLHNILWDGRISGLLDWEWAGAGSPLLDLAWLRWTMRFRGLPDGLWQAFCGSYGPPSLADDPETLRALALGQIAAILARVSGQPEARAEWLRRARWTMESGWGSADGLP